MEVFAVQAADELSARVSYDDSDVDAVHTDANVGSRRDRLLSQSARRKKESASGKKGRAALRGNKHG
jgi:hypothetical protein